MTKSFHEYQKEIAQTCDVLSKRQKVKQDLLKKMENIGCEISKVDTFSDGAIFYTPDYSFVNDLDSVKRNFKNDCNSLGIGYDSGEFNFCKYLQVFRFFKNFSGIKVVLDDVVMKDKKMDVIYEYSHYAGKQPNKCMFPAGLENIITFFKDKGMNKKLINKLKSYSKIAEDLS
jgi:hypothetical protein